MQLRNISKMAGIAVLLAGSTVLAQGPGDAEQPPPAPAAAPMPPAAPLPPQPARPPMERAMGRWWNNPELAERLSVTAEQKQKIDDIVFKHKLNLIDLHAALQKAETIMEPLMAADQPDEAKILAQIDRIAQARAELEKANARMLLAIRQVLTPEQWKKLQEEHPSPLPRPAASGRPPRR